MTLNIRKIAVVAGFAAGAALAFAPLAAADSLDPVVTSTLDSEAAILNGLFLGDTTFSGVPSSSVDTSGLFDIIKPADVATVQGDPTHLTLFDYLVYGANPAEAGLASDPGSYNVFNGALTQFYNAYDVELYSALNGGTLDTDPTDYIQNGALDHALTLANTTEAASYLFNFGLGDLEGFFGIFPPA